jgi:hypothetical protein
MNTNKKRKPSAGYHFCIARELLVALAAISVLSVQQKCAAQTNDRTSTLPHSATSAGNNHPQAVLDVMQRVADWQLAHPSPHKLTDWTQGTGDAGFMALAGISGDPKYRDAMLAMVKTNGWQLAQQQFTSGSCGTFFKKSCHWRNYPSRAIRPRRNCSLKRVTAFLALSIFNKDAFLQKSY